VRVPTPGHNTVAAPEQDPKASAIQLPDSAPSASARSNSVYPGSGVLVGTPTPHAAGSSATGGGSGIQLSFTDVDINQVVASVLGEALELNYSIDPSVKGTMSLRSSKALGAEELLPALEAALRVHHGV
jgi:type II secretory pathway component GspD/PulD (secretin)